MQESEDEGEGDEEVAGSAIEGKGDELHLSACRGFEGLPVNIALSASTAILGQANSERPKPNY